MQVEAIFGTAFMVGLSGAMMPGPLLSSVIAESTRRGWLAGPLTMIGHGILELALIAAIMAGLASFLTQPYVVMTIGILGGLFLLYLGFTMCREALAARIELPSADSAAPGSLNPVWAGALISVSNPYWTIWWATIGLTYLTLAMNFGWYGVMVFFCGHILADLSWYSIVSSVVAGGRNWLSHQVYNGILAFCGLFLLGMGVYFLFSSI